MHGQLYMCVYIYIYIYIYIEPSGRTTSLVLAAWSSHLPTCRSCAVSFMRVLVNSKLLWDLAHSNMCIMHNVTISAPLPP